MNPEQFITITINGIKYSLNVGRAKELNLIEPAFVPKAIGQRYRWRKGIDEVYILCTPQPDVCQLININSGCCWNSAARVNSMYAINEEEWKNIAGVYGDELELVK